MRPPRPIAAVLGAAVALLASATACGERRLKPPPPAAATVTVVIAPSLSGLGAPAMTGSTAPVPTGLPSTPTPAGAAPGTTTGVVPAGTTAPTPPTPTTTAPPGTTAPSTTASPATTATRTSAPATTTSATAPAVPATAVRMIVTRDFGGRAMRNQAVSAGQSVIAALQTVAKVTTAYSGGFVQSIDGVAGSRSAERDWFFFVDGIEADRGGAELDVRAGQTVWWDQRQWKNRMRAPVVVGTWPEPFLHGYTTDPAGVAADAPLDAALRAAGARVVTKGTRSTYVVLVGADTALRQRSSAWSAAESKPASSGLTAWFASDGVVHVWDAAAQKDLAVPAATAVIAAVPTGTEASDGVTFAVAGTTAAAASAAATALARDPALVASAYAVCLDASARIVCRGGQGLAS